MSSSLNIADLTSEASRKVLGTTPDTIHGPTSDMDFWSEEVLSNPYPYYKTLRDLGPAVWLTRHNAWAITHHEGVRFALANADIFSSAQGVTMNEPSNKALQDGMLASDDPAHKNLRRIFAKPLLPGAIAALKDRLVELAEKRVDELVSRVGFDAVKDLAHFLPVTVVTELVGLSEEGKSNMLLWAAGAFDAFGPMTHARTVSGIQVMEQAFHYLVALQRDSLDPNGWGAALFAAADRGDITVETAKAMLMDYLVPALDTTINATSSAVWLFAQNPDQWVKLRENPHLISSMIDEVLRVESPVRAFSRVVTRDFEIGGNTLPTGSRVLVVYASANRDERRYPDPDRFDISRDARDHVGFGHGTHICPGMHLARLEITVLFEILIKRINSWQILGEARNLNNTLRGLSRLDVEVDVD